MKWRHYGGQGGEGPGGPVGAAGAVSGAGEVRVSVGVVVVIIGLDGEPEVGLRPVVRHRGVSLLRLVFSLENLFEFLSFQVWIGVVVAGDRGGPGSAGRLAAAGPHRLLEEDVAGGRGDGVGHVVPGRRDLQLGSPANINNAELQADKHVCLLEIAVNFTQIKISHRK